MCQISLSWKNRLTRRVKSFQTSSWWESIIRADKRQCIQSMITLVVQTYKWKLIYCTRILCESQIRHSSHALSHLICSPELDAQADGNRVLRLIRRANFPNIKILLINNRVQVELTQFWWVSTFTLHWTDGFTACNTIGHYPTFIQIYRIAIRISGCQNCRPNKITSCAKVNSYIYIEHVALVTIVIHNDCELFVNSLWSARDSDAGTKVAIYQSFSSWTNHKVQTGRACSRLIFVMSWAALWKINLENFASSKYLNSQN